MITHHSTGHAFEGRIYAENVPKGYLPATGVLHHYCPVPVSSTGEVPTKNARSSFSDVETNYLNPHIGEWS